ncbi:MULTISPECIES: hypothetical protein [unclassified Zobellia]|uniref:hypothetical protein n=1 Tax=unclassified Zobellia TaxID=2620635 RepID=UPI001C074306|nr:MULTISPECIES: hypothetical protein [unclassified Zobellia]MBU2974622.1 hypothetical protein [Zobellia sp. B3R18]MDO6820692.1 hypothetical protein [Zobellia sp. 1_MG-2023]
MENSGLRSRILIEIENLIASSCTKQKVPPSMKKLHIAILKNHYNAAKVSIDYHRRRVEMDIVMDDKDYDPKKVNLSIPTLHTNLWFRNLYDFLVSCIDQDPKSVAFYSMLLKSYQNNEISLVA